MSYDLYLYPENKRSEPLTRDEFHTLDNKFTVKVLREDSQGRVLDFSVKYKENNPSWIDDEEEGFEIFWQPDGYYWHYVSYGVNDEVFDYFKRLTIDLAKVLSLKIQDPQVGDDIISPDEYEGQNKKSEKRFEIAQQVTQKIFDNSFLYEPAESTYFIKLFIRAWDPNASNPNMLILLEGGNQMYCSKVEKDQTLHEVLEKEVPPLIDSNYYKVMTVTDGDFDFDRQGRKLPRKNVFIDIPYFDPKSRNLKYNMVWV